MFHDCIAAQAHCMLKTLLAPTEESSALHKYLAAFIVRRGKFYSRVLTKVLKGLKSISPFFFYLRSDKQGSKI